MTVRILLYYVIYSNLNCKIYDYIHCIANPSRYKMQTVLPIYTNFKCAKEHGYFYMDYRIICAGERNGNNPCYVSGTKNKKDI